MSSTEMKRIQPLEYFNQHIEQGRRLDGRTSLNSLRPVALSVGTISTSDGSSVVKQGNTIFTCGIKLELAEPKAEEPNKGFIIPNVDLPPLCHSMFKPGPPSEQAQTAAMFIRDVLSNSECIDHKQLCIAEGKLCWVLYIDLICLNYDGNIHDCAMKAVTTALRNVRLPSVTIDSDDKISCSDSDRSPLRLASNPISCSFALHGDTVLVDPTEEEERFARGTVTIVLAGSEVCHIHKPGGIAISQESLDKCITVAKSQAKIVEKMIEKAEPVNGLDSR